VGKSRFTFVHLGKKDMQVVIITKALLLIIIKIRRRRKDK
jgi:hypothetical protein